MKLLKNVHNFLIKININYMKFPFEDINLFKFQPLKENHNPAMFKTLLSAFALSFLIADVLSESEQCGLCASKSQSTEVACRKAETGQCQEKYYVRCGWFYTSRCERRILFNISLNIHLIIIYCVT
jgi:hypothetical protein